MTVLVIYESMWGATKAVAEAIGAGLGEADVRVVDVGEAEPVVPGDVDLLVVGGPTHAFGMTRASTRANAAKDHPPVLSPTGVREWLETAKLPAGLACAAFDTKVVTPDLPGSAGKGIDKSLRRLGGHPVAKPTTFRVHGKWDGLAEGEAERARAWGAELAATLS
ncbi:flavodoxin domain-containing protein [Actinotalea sp. M2MS4P-6]|uniref:flavodoxin family protein n=1 Tax=Actinotalea sp. M2MS4P-6 TaxID=2983762 RepID=UPI0021E38AD2|nr:flavodoxin domain-containing protein [Actinotalea sp. M2MS4P-6]MCV2394879.1 flavodoxin domain-containing protein [Actinotalea sp. M2MS4P-6]